VDLMSEGRLTGPRFLQALRTAAPDREFRSRYGGAMGASMRRLEAGDLDVALGRAEWRGQRRSKAIRTRLIRYEPLALILPDFHPFAGLTAVPVAAVSGTEIDANPATPEATEWLNSSWPSPALPQRRPTKPRSARTTSRTISSARACQS
jgi:hypothetical protein